jgi:hypothetical protein
MQDASSRLVDILERLTTDMAELTDLAGAVSIPEAQKASLRAILQQFYFILEQEDIGSPEPQSVTQVPVFNANNLARTIHTAASDENALRTVMLSTGIPLHWNTIYARIYPLIKAQLRPQDELPQTGHPGLLRWQYRLSWQMQLLRAEGVVRSVGDGYWMRIDPDAPKLQTALFDE